MAPSTAISRDTVWTWTDYQGWPAGERWELIDGRAFAMAPAPSTAHQAVAGRLFAHIERALKGKPCRPFIAPTDVKLSDLDVVQPDILVVCEPSRILPTHIAGAPDLVVEVLSPATATRDLREKKALYARYGVREYLIVDPLEHYAMRFVLVGEAYDAGAAFGPDETLDFAGFADLAVPLWEVFDLPAPGSVAPARGPGG